VVNPLGENGNNKNKKVLWEEIRKKYNLTGNFSPHAIFLENKKSIMKAN